MYIYFSMSLRNLSNRKYPANTTEDACVHERDLYRLGSSTSELMQYVTFDEIYAAYGDGSIEAIEHNFKIGNPIADDKEYAQNPNAFGTLLDVNTLRIIKAGTPMPINVIFKVNDLHINWDYDKCTIRAPELPDIDDKLMHVLRVLTRNMQIVRPNPQGFVTAATDGYYSRMLYDDDSRLPADPHIDAPVNVFFSKRAHQIKENADRVLHRNHGEIFDTFMLVRLGAWFQDSKLDFRYLDFIRTIRFNIKFDRLDLFQCETRLQRLVFSDGASTVYQICGIQSLVDAVTRFIPNDVASYVAPFDPR